MTTATLKQIATGVSITALVIWSWLDMKTYTGPEGWVATRWRIGLFALMVVAACVAWLARARGDKDEEQTR